MTLGILIGLVPAYKCVQSRSDASCRADAAHDCRMAPRKPICRDNA